VVKLRASHHGARLTHAWPVVYHHPVERNNQSLDNFLVAKKNTIGGIVLPVPQRVEFFAVCDLRLNILVVLI
jgi:hypothetical protein